MGWNTTIVVYNDALGDIEKDPQFGKNLAAAVSQAASGKRIDIAAGSHCNAAHVVESHHADSTVVVTVGGNIGIKRAHVHGWRDGDELQKDLIEQWAEKIGYKLVKMNKTKKT